MTKRRMTHPPLVYSLCQVKFSPVLQMAEFVPAIQEQLRRRFPGFRKEEIRSVTIDHNQSPQFEQETRWVFNAPDDTSGFILNSTSLVYHTASYEDSNAFRSELICGLASVGNHAEPHQIERVGLRYIDFIQPAEGKEVANYVKPGLLSSPLSGMVAAVDGTQSVFRGTTNWGTLIQRFTVTKHSSTVPPDLLPTTINVAGVHSPPRMAGVLDTDHFCERKFPFSIDEVTALLKGLHDEGTSLAFWAAVTDEALEEWQ